MQLEDNTTDTPSEEQITLASFWSQSTDNLYYYLNIILKCQEEDDLSISNIISERIICAMVEANASFIQIVY